MARPLRIEFSGAVYHVTSRGNARGEIYFGDADRHRFLNLLSEVCLDCHWRCYAYCLMDNHYHLLIETGDSTLARGMRQLNGMYTQSINRKNARVGHLFQGRYKAILVEKDAYLLELSRYIVLNPVRARMVHQAVEWPWSSYRATAGICEPHIALFVDQILSLFGHSRIEAVSAYKSFVAEGINQPSPWEQLKNQVYLGSDAFVEEVQCKMSPDQPLSGVPEIQKRASSKPLEYYQQRFLDRDEAITKAYLSGHYTQEQIGQWFGISSSRVSKIIRQFKACR